MTTATPTETPTTVHRFEVRRLDAGADPQARRAIEGAAALGLEPTAVRVARVYLIEGALDADRLERLRTELFNDPVTESTTLGARESSNPEGGAVVVEVHPKPGVMDPPALTVEGAVADLVGVDVQVSTGWRYEFEGLTADDAGRLARAALASGVIHDIHTRTHHPAELPHGSPAEFRLTHITIRDLSDDELITLSREGHLFLSLEEMRALRDEYRRLEREPTDIELETLAQTWSEHCVHKTLKSIVSYRSDTYLLDDIEWRGRPGVTVHEDGSVTIDNLLRSTVAAATHELIADGVDWTLSVFVDNAGIIEFDDDHAVCVKVETHNHPSAIEPYGGAATGIGGCIRDIIGTGKGARPIGSTDVFCVANPDMESVPTGCLPPKRILREIVAGVRDYGNRMGIPTVNGAVWFDDRYVGNPLVYCGSVGVMPRHSNGGEHDDMISGDARPGDRIIALGGRTGRDGIHGATFSSAELTDSHADEFAHAVQIGNAIEEKRVLDAILRARDAEGGPLYTSITDCGAGGFSSAVGEMGERLGAEVHLDRAPLKYDGLTYDEIWISEAQERMVLAVPEHRLPSLQTICDEEGVELADLGSFGTPDRELVLNFNGVEVGRMSMAFLHDGIPTPTRSAVWTPPTPATTPVARTAADRLDLGEALHALLSHPNIASKHWIVRQYDHEVQGGTAIKPLVGPLGQGPGDASVLRPVPGSSRGLAVGCGLATGLEADPYQMALAAIDECVRNLICVGADPDRIAILDNFCWPSCGKEQNLASLVRAAVGCYDAAKAYRTPFVSGKDSLNNQFTTDTGETIEIPPTLLITGIGIVPDVARCVTSDAKAPGNLLLLVGPGLDDEPRLGGSHLERTLGIPPGASDKAPEVELSRGPVVARAVAALIRSGLVRSAHDVSDGGPLVSVAEMCIAGSSPGQPIGAALDAFAGSPASWFAEHPSSYVLEISSDHAGEVSRILGSMLVASRPLGMLNDTGEITGDGLRERTGSLRASWLGTLDWGGDQAADR